MADGGTLPMNLADRERARELSLQKSRPPASVPGYQAETLLGKGAFGEVWVASDLNTGRRVAIKFYNHREGLDWSLLSREVEKLAFLFNDRYVVQLIEVGWEANPPYYVMEYLEQGSLEDRLRGGPLPVAAALPIFRDVAIGLVHAHGKGVLHCDLKPANVLLDQDGRPRLADFGQSRLSHEQAPSLGTLFYMAPEQADLHAAPDARWDVYALGALFYRMVTGRAPHHADGTAKKLSESADLPSRLAEYRRLLEESPRPTGHRKVRGMDRALAEILDRCLATQPQKRYPNPQAVLDALDARAAQRSRRPMLVLGALGPLLLFLLMAPLAWNSFRMAVSESENALSERALESNHFAAQSIAERVAGEIDRRWKILEQETSEPAFKKLFHNALGKPVGDPARKALQSWLEDQHVNYNASTPTDAWLLNDATGRQLARSPFDANTIDRDFSFRDYFQGQGRDLPNGSSGIRPIRQPYRSVLFDSRADQKRRVAFSIPIWEAKPDGGEKEVIGVIAMSVQLANLAEFRPYRTRPGEARQLNQFSSIVESKVDGTGRPGLILQHPGLEAAAPSASRQPPRWRPEDVRRLEEIRRLRRQGEEPSEKMTSLRDFQDPMGGDFGGEWLAALEPVFVEGRPPSVRDTGWFVVVQERIQSALGPVDQLKAGLFARGLLAFGLAVAVMTVLWGFVVRVLSESSRSQLRAAVRQQQTGSGGSGLSDSSSGTPQGTGQATENPANLRGASTIQSPAPSPEKSLAAQGKGSRWPS